MARCDNCGKGFPIERLDAKPGPGVWTADELARAADDGTDFEWLECRDCYGPNFTDGAK